jgi:two-component system, OmpR family, sensor histidine kinase BaeS
MNMRESSQPFFRGLKARLILTHLLPLFFILPAVALTLIYLLETQVVLTSLTDELKGQAELIASMAGEQGDIWSDTNQARAFITRHSTIMQARIMVLDAEGNVVASSDSDQAPEPQQRLQIPGLDSALSGETTVNIDPRRYLVTEYVSYTQYAEVADVLVPVIGPDQQVKGIIRLTHQIDTIHDRFLDLRRFIWAVVLAGLVISAGMGWWLASRLGQPLQQATLAVHGLATGERMGPLPEDGPDEIRLLIQAVNSLAERLHTMETSRRQLLANLVHELGRPLGALRSAIQALQGGANDDIALREELLVGMDGEVGRLKRLVDDLAQFYDQALGTLEIDRRRTDVNPWLHDTLPPWREAALAKGLRWHTTIPDDLPCVEMDPDRLAQAIGNLLVNAIKYTPSGGVISVSAGTRDGCLWIEISDTGPGLSADEQRNIFTPLYRGRASGRFPQGMGLGLPIARDLVTAHNGRLEVESDPGEGSRFIILIPLLGTERC